MPVVFPCCTGYCILGKKYWAGVLKSVREEIIVLKVSEEKTEGKPYKILS